MTDTNNTASRIIDAAALFAGESAGVRHDVRLTIRGGVIDSIAPLPAEALPAPPRLVLPALVNAHDHARPAASSFGAMNMPLETWILRSVLGTPPDAYLQAAASLGNAAKAGCGAMMVHYTRPSGRLPIVDEAAEIARAAADVGIRLAFALAVRDQNPVVYGDAEPVLAALPAASRVAVEELFVRTPPSPQSYIALVEEIADRIAGPMVDVQFGPAGVQWCSRQLLQAIARRSEETGRRIHMHLLETVHQRAWADQEYPGGIVRYLADIGFLSDRLTLAHCIHARPDELDLIARHGARIVTNFSSNLHLHSGLAPIASAHRRGCAIAVGIDGLALDEDSDMLREMRLVQMMHDGSGFDRTWSRTGFLHNAIATGRAATGAPGNGELRPGAPADLTIIDLDRLDRDKIMPLDALDLLFARANSSHIADVIVAGRSISLNGTVSGLDLPAIEAELRRLYRAEMPRHGAFLARWPAIEAGVGVWFRQHCGCS
jgi:cytosine/adenosine deaminase-related metal-dependent hydrolase